MTEILNPKQKFRTFEHLNLDIVSNLVLRASNFKKRSQRGVSLIEVIISMFMIAVLLILYAGALNTVALTKKLKYENLAYHVGNKQMEILRGTAFASLPASATISDPMLAQIPSGSGNFTTADYPGFSGLKEIVVTVTWNDGVAKQVVIRSLAGSGGINP